jgi:ribosome maturation factor RimP
VTGVPATRVRAAVEPPLAGAGFDLEDVAVRAAGRRTLVQVVVDRDGGITLDDVAEASRLVSTALDEHDPLDGAYVLEVTSPGVDRPLTAPRHWRRNAGRLVRVTTADGVTTGRIETADDTGATLVTESGPARVEYADVRVAKVEVEFTREAE